MNNAQYTPGPWRITETGPAKRYVIDGFVDSIAMTYGQDRQEADARLIAAAPDLLEVLQYVLDADQYDGALTMGTAALSPAIRDRVKRAIAQATEVS